MADRDRAPIHARDLGAGEPIVFVHGDLADGAGAWGPQLELADRRRLIVVDRRGHGESPREPRPYTPASDAADVLEVAARLGLPPYHLVGHSHGGLTAIEVALSAPASVRSLHLLEPPYLALGADDPAVAPLLARGRAIFREAAGRDPAETAAAFVEMLAGPAGLERVRARPGWADVVREAAAIGDTRYPGEYDPARLEELSRVVTRTRLPIRVYTGGRSHPGLRRIAHTLADRLPGATLLEIETATHAIQRERDAFNTAILASTT